jgi:hypothetical protein
MKRLRLETPQSEVTAARRRADLIGPLWRAFARPRNYPRARRNAWFAGCDVGWIYGRRRDQSTATCKRPRRSLSARLVRKSLGCG